MDFLTKATFFKLAQKINYELQKLIFSITEKYFATLHNMIEQDQVPLYFSENAIINQKLLQQTQCIINKTTHSTIQKLFTQRQSYLLPDLQNIIMEYSSVQSDYDTSDVLHTIINNNNHLNSFAYRLMCCLIMHIVSWFTLCVSFALRFVEIQLILFLSKDQAERCIQCMINKWFGNSRSAYMPLLLQYRVKYVLVSTYFVDHWCPSSFYFHSLQIPRAIDLLIQLFCVFFVFVCVVCVVWR